MWMRVANSIDRRLVVQPFPDYLDAFPEGTRVLLSCTNRVISIERDDSSRTVCLVDAIYCNESFPLSIRSKIYEALPAFTVSEAEFEIVGNRASWAVPPDHELPWSTIAPKVNVEEVVREQLSCRVRSAIESGADVKATVQMTPAWARGVLPGDEWMSIVTGDCV